MKKLIVIILPLLINTSIYPISYPLSTKGGIKTIATLTGIGAVLYTLNVYKDWKMENESSLNKELSDAIVNDDIEKLQNVLQKGVNLNCNEWVSPISPLTLAAFHGRYQMVKLLVEKGALLNISPFNGLDPLSAAILSKDSDTINCLLEANISIKMIHQGDGWLNGAISDFFKTKEYNYFSLSPLWAAIATNDIQLVELLISKGAQTNILTVGKNLDIFSDSIYLLEALLLEASPAIIDLLLNAGAHTSNIFSQEGLIYFHHHRSSLDPNTYITQKGIIHLNSEYLQKIEHLLSKYELTPGAHDIKPLVNNSSFHL